MTAKTGDLSRRSHTAPSTSKVSALLSGAMECPDLARRLGSTPEPRESEDDCSAGVAACDPLAATDCLGGDRWHDCCSCCLSAGMLGSSSLTAWGDGGCSGCGEPSSSSNVSPTHAPCSSSADRYPTWRLSGGRRVGWRWYVAVCALSWLCYANALGCGFVFDDASAVRDNRDLRPSTPIGSLFANDFWGTPIHKEQSHKSYRPLCVLTFRLNYWLHELRPMGYHLGNVLLHSIVCVLFLRVCSMVVPVKASVAAALLFAVHPVHTEAVTGVVGRAESLSSVFFLLAFLAYNRAIDGSKRTEWRPLAACVVLVVVATLCKEQGITVVAVCFIYEIFVVQEVRPHHVIRGLRSLSGSAVCGSPSSTKSSSVAPPCGWLRHCAQRIGALSLGAFLLLAVRLHIMGAQLPVFTKFDNPAAVAPSPVRQLTFHYLPAVNAWLLLFPHALCCDWTMGSVALVRSVADPRNAATLSLYGALAALAYVALFPGRRARPADDQQNVIFLSLSLLVFPFLPASNLFFPVGFVVAERVLYMPSMGFCLLVAHGWHTLIKNYADSRLTKNFLWFGLLLLLTTHSLKTFVRNFEWESEYSIFMAGLKVNSQNAKLYNNVGHALEGQGDYAQALEYFLKAASVQPDDIGAHMNVGRTYNNLLMFEEAETAFRKAKDLLPRPKPGEPYKARIAPNHLNVFLNLANLISRNSSRLEEADGLYRQAISMRVDYIQAYINRGDILIKLNRTKEAQEVYERALSLDATNPDIFYNLGVVFLEQGRPGDALMYFNKALELDPDHEQALMNSAILIQESGNSKLRQLAFERLELLLRKGKANERVYFNLGMLSMDDKKVEEAERWFHSAIQVKADFRSALFNLALLLTDSNRPLDAVPHLQKLLQSHPDHIKGLILLGDIYINHIKDLDKAQQCYERILSLQPDHVQALHNLCVVQVERGALYQAEACLLRALKLAPGESYVAKHLAIVRNRIRKYQEHLRKAGTRSASSSVPPTTSSSSKRAAQSSSKAT
ncbi:protein O-mannosyl-transferase Tmtc3 isoform X3 [Dermacentor silvarum]|uniref:protein O-mannosyl-transferase Tmtc3 isoform X3 n=1 Tax=Dermacentor silvarum TaxID=543639 RepID=UPI0021016011|nr:protein O-mannosyl-transferase Tmtc3 isoform X3 [Dermacentor silvarum]